MDQFAQSREDDDLFGDDFEPVPTPTVIEDQAAKPVDDRLSSAGGENSQINENTQDYRREQGGQGRGRGQGGAYRGQERNRGRGGSRGGPNAGLAASRYAPQAAPASAQAKAESGQNAQAATTNTTIIALPLEAANTANDTDDANTTDNNDTTNTDENTPSDPQTTSATTNATATELEKPHRIAAVRGDRSLTGGPTHKKLSEAEMTEKMAKMAILNAQKAEKFRRTEADSAAFLQKEAEIKKKRVEEQKNAREMDKERARNRERKLKAQGGREWDSEKVEADIVDARGRGRSSEFVRGGHGGVIRGGGLGGSRFAGAEDSTEESQSSRGRGGFEIRGRGNRGGRGGRGGKSTAMVPNDDDFPLLPTAKSTKSSTVQETIKSPATEQGGHDWAEEMATPVEEKKMSV